MKLCDILNIQKGITSIIGGGGKSTLIDTLALELKSRGKVIITTTTHICKSSIFQTVITDDEKLCISSIKKALNEDNCVLVGSATLDEKLTKPSVELKELSKLCDYLLVEADGSKHLPLKAHESFEPVIAKGSNKTIAVVGIDALNKPVNAVTHRVKRLSELCDVKPTDIVTTEVIAKLLNTEKLHDIVLINKCDTITDTKNAQKLSKLLNTKSVITSLKKGKFYVSSN